MMKKTVVGYLTYITVKNSNNRLLDFILYANSIICLDLSQCFKFSL